jgi:phage gp29-like protein
MARPDRKEHRELWGRRLTTWTNSELTAARLLADGGTLSYAAELVDELRADSRVQGVLPQRVNGLLGLELEFEASGDGRRRGRAVRALEADEDWWQIAPEHELADLQTWGLLLGVGLAELVWTTNERGRVIPRLKCWDPRWLRWDWQQRRWMLRTDDEGEIEIAPGGGKWVVYTPYGTSRPWSKGLWRGLAKWWLLKGFSLTDWARHSEMHGSPIRVGVAPEGSQPEDREHFADDLASLGSDTSIVAPPGYELRLLEATAKTWEQFPKQIETANAELSILLVGQNLTSEVQGGSFAAAKIHQNIRDDLIRFDAEALATCLHDQVLTWWAEFNFGDAGLAPWPQWDTKPPPPPAPAAPSGQAASSAPMNSSDPAEDGEDGEDTTDDDPGT